MDKSNNFTSKISGEIGEAFGMAIWKSRKEIYNKKQRLENPNSLENYRNSFPTFLLNFFDKLIITLEKRKHEILNKKRRQRNSEEKNFDIIYV